MRRPLKRPSAAIACRSWRSPSARRRSSRRRACCLTSCRSGLVILHTLPRPLDRCARKEEGQTRRALLPGPYHRKERGRALLRASSHRFPSSPEFRRKPEARACRPFGAAIGRARCVRCPQLAGAGPPPRVAAPAVVTDPVAFQLSTDPWRAGTQGLLVGAGGTGTSEYAAGRDERSPERRKRCLTRHWWEPASAARGRAAACSAPPASPHLAPARRHRFRRAARRGRRLTRLPPSSARWPRGRSGAASRGRSGAGR